MIAHTQPIFRYGMIHRVHQLTELRHLCPFLYLKAKFVLRAAHECSGLLRFKDNAFYNAAIDPRRFFFLKTIKKHKTRGSEAPRSEERRVGKECRYRRS